jgi:hypothetical protein
MRIIRDGVRHRRGRAWGGACSGEGPEATRVVSAPIRVYRAEMELDV